MARIFLILLPILLAAALVLSVRACTAEPEQHYRVGPEGSGIVALDDGSTLVAKKGTVGRDLVDWLARRGDGQRSFELGGHQFVGRTMQPTAETIGRLPRLVAMLKANPDVKAMIVGHTDPSGDAKEDQAVALERARTLARLLEDRGIETDRLMVESRGASQPVAKNDTSAGRAANQRVSLILMREQ